LGLEIDQVSFVTSQIAYSIHPTILMLSEVEVKSVCLGVEPTLGLVTGYYFLAEGCCLKVEVLCLRGALSDERTGLH
jgi:hypothetical protein